MKKLSKNKYGVIHTIINRELFTPLVASQVFDQAEVLASTKIEGNPYKIAVWALEPMRVAFDSRTRQKIAELKLRCPSIDIRCLGGINRLNNWPRIDYLGWLRKRKFGDVPVIYHCRTESALLSIKDIKVKFPDDKFHLDIRGHWPSEALYRNGKELKDKHDYFDTYYPKPDDQRLLEATLLSDSISVVSKNLKDIMDDYYIKKPISYIVPCCIKKVNNRTNRERIREELGVKINEKIIVYSGGIASYQHLEDIVIPLMKQLLLDTSIWVLFLSHNKSEIEEIITKQKLARDRVLVLSVPQVEVEDYLSACDAGLMIRKPTLVNKVANPVKIAEYLAAGVPVILQKGIGSVEEDIKTYNAGLVVDLFSGIMLEDVAKDIIHWIYNNKEEDIVSNSLKLATEKYMWEGAVKIHINNYVERVNDYETNWDDN